MTTDTKVADLPAAWRATGKAAGATPVAATFNACADELEAALARQEADNASSPNVIYRWRALDYSGFCYGSNPPHDLPSEACLTAFYRDPEGLRSALHEISATGNMTATDKQFSRHLQQIARDALAVATPPAAQAVDLEQFRDCVIEAKEVWLQNAENWKGRSRESRYREWVDDCDRLLALIDQQAGKAGGAA